jgi:class 3 adenylate cyclase
MRTATLVTQPSQFLLQEIEHPRCAKCASENTPKARFCVQCAAPFDAVGPIHAESAPHEGLSGERRHLTVLFCDLVGSTEIASHLDPEEWREIVASYHRVAAQAIERFDGHVAQYLGDGVMAYFGYPEAHDNDAERAAPASPFTVPSADGRTGRRELAADDGG